MYLLDTNILIHFLNEIRSSKKTCHGLAWENWPYVKSHWPSYIMGHIIPKGPRKI
jgi:hypothetical protein